MTVITNVHKHSTRDIPCIKYASFSDFSIKVLEMGGAIKFSKRKKDSEFADSKSLLPQ
jgi:hypothetical protein